MAKSWIMPLAVAALALPSAAVSTAFAQSGTKGGAAEDTMKLTTSSFTHHALMDGEKELALGKLAEANTENSEVKQFAQMIVHDHTEANEQLRKLIKAEGNATPPGRMQKSQNGNASPPGKVAPGAAPMHSEEFRRLDGLKGKPFDRRFLTIMVRDHVKAVDLFRTASTQLSDGPAKEFAAKTLPTLEMHLSEAKRLQAQMGND